MKRRPASGLGPAAGRPTLQMPGGGAGVGLGFSENLSPRTHIARFFFPPSFFPSFHQRKALTARFCRSNPAHPLPPPLPTPTPPATDSWTAFSGPVAPRRKASRHHPVDAANDPAQSSLISRSKPRVLSLPGVAIFSPFAATKSLPFSRHSPQSPSIQKTYHLDRFHCQYRQNGQVSPRAHRLLSCSYCPPEPCRGQPAQAQS